MDEVILTITVPSFSSLAICCRYQCALARTKPHVGVPSQLAVPSPFFLLPGGCMSESTSRAESLST